MINLQRFINHAKGMFKVENLDLQNTKQEKRMLTLLNALNPELDIEEELKYVISISTSVSDEYVMEYVGKEKFNQLFPNLSDVDTNLNPDLSLANRCAALSAIYTALYPNRNLQEDLNNVKEVAPATTLGYAGDSLTSKWMYMPDSESKIQLNNNKYFDENATGKVTTTIVGEGGESKEVTRDMTEAELTQFYNDMKEARKSAKDSVQKLISTHKSIFGDYPRSQLNRWSKSYLDRLFNHWPQSNYSTWTWEIKSDHNKSQSTQ